MKNNIRKISAFLLAVLSAFVIFPFNTVHASSVQQSWNNLIDWYRTAIGALYIDNGSVNGLTRDELYTRLYDTELKYPIRGELVSFRPSDRFTNAREWVDACNGDLPSSSPAYDDFSDFNIGECLKESGFIEDTGSGYKVGIAPTITNSTNGEYPLDGVEVKTNFGDFDNGFGNKYLAQNVFNQVKSNIISNADNYTIFSSSINTTSSNVFYGYSDVDFVYFIISSSGTISNRLYYFNNGVWGSTRAFSNYINSNSTNSTVSVYYASTGLQSWLFNGNNLSFNNSDISYTSSSSSNTVYSPYSVYSTLPVVIASSEANAKNYYYWKNGNPSGGFYSTSNNNNVYSYDVVNNNNWNNAYNNYITDVSNYYSTTSNITNEQITQYIDKSTTINNITNNYITNVVNPDNPDDPSGGGVITNSWLERIYEKLEYIIDILLGRHDPETDTVIYNDNSIKNMTIYYPLSDLFPDVPETDFLPDSDTFDFSLAGSKLGTVISKVIPFCYLAQLLSVAQALSAPPRAPNYDIPFVIERLNINEVVSIDLSGSAWEVLHSVWIVLFMIGFVSALFYLTYKYVQLISSFLGK